MNRNKPERKGSASVHDDVALAPEDVPESEWQLAIDRFNALIPLVENGSTKEQIRLVEQKIGLKKTQCHELIRRLKNDPRPEALLLGKRGRTKGSKCLSENAEDITQSTIEWCLDQPEPYTDAEIFKQVQLACHKKKIKCPSKKAIKTRLRAIPEFEKKSRKYGKAVAEREHGQDASPISAKYPLEHVQIDHTKVDVLIVDSATGMEIGRPWLTLAIDVFTRVILGIYLSLEAPSAISLACCLANVICTKRDYLSTRGMDDVDWPMFGFPRRIHVDNGADMHSQAFKRGCQNLGIELTYRIPGQPHSGGIVERVFRTLMSRVHTVPGTTGSNSKARKNYKSEVRAFLTLWDIENFLIHDVIRYHNSVHRTLSTSPQGKWISALKEGNAPKSNLGAKTRKEIYVALLPSEVRKITDQRIHLRGHQFIGEYLKENSGLTVRVHYHPQDCRCIYIRDKGGKIFEAVNYDPALCVLPRSYEESRIQKRHLTRMANDSDSSNRQYKSLSAQGQVISKAKERQNLRNLDRRKRVEEQKLLIDGFGPIKPKKSSVDYAVDVQPFEVMK